MTASETPVSVCDHGEADDHLDTNAFQSAIDTCADAGGGTVRVPSGEYVTGTVRLRSDVTLRIEAGAVVKPADDEEEYATDHVGPDGERVFFLADDVDNVTLEGDGEFDGRGTEFMQMDTPIRGHSNESAAHPLISNAPHDARQGDAYLDRSDGTEGWPVAKPDFRPGPMFRFDGCTDVTVRDLTLRDMPAWTVSLHGCEEVDVLGVDILNHMLIPNCDGIHVGDSRNVHVSDCTIRSCDDSITFGARPDEDVTCEGVTVTNCTLASSACAIKFGSGTDDVIRDCVFQNIVVEESNRGLGIQHRDAGVVENVLFSDIVIDSNLLPGPWWGKGEPIYVTSVRRDEDTDLGSVRNVRFSNVVARSEHGALVYGGEDADIRNVEFDGVSIELAGSQNADRVGGNFDLQPTAVTPPIFEHDIAAVHVENADDVRLSDVDVSWADQVPDYYTGALTTADVTGLVVDDLVGRQAHRNGSDPVVRFEETSDITVRNCRATPGATTFLSLDATSDERLFANNDLSDADTAADADLSAFGGAGNLLPES